jgi:magnesium chelatase accessory protein
MSSRPTWDAVRADWPNSRHSRFLSAGGIRWHVQVAGTGPAVLLLHGTASASFSWRDVLPALAPFCTVIAPDLPGHGFTEADDPGALSLTGMSRALRTLLDALALEPVVAAGHSAGAAIITRMALDHRLAARTLVGFSAALIPPAASYLTMLAPLINPLATSPLAAKAAAAMAELPFVVDAVLNATGSPISAEQRALYAMFFRSESHDAAAFSMMANWDVPTLLRDASALAVPLTLLHGSRDTFIPVAALRTAVAGIPTASLTVVEGAGHLLHEQRPALAVSAIRDALGSSDTLNTGTRQNAP